MMPSNPEPRDVLAGFFGAVNRQDVESAMSFLAEDFVFRVPLSGFFASKSQIHTLLALDASFDVRVNYDIIRESRDAIVCTVTAFFGEDCQRYRAAFRFRGASITEEVIEPCPDAGLSAGKAREASLTYQAQVAKLWDDCSNARLDGLRIGSVCV